jgi:hypothetical protein
VIENGTVSTAAFESDGNNLRVTIAGGAATARVYVLEIMTSWPVTHATMANGDGDVTTIDYDTRSLQASVTVALPTGSGTVALGFDASLADPMLLRTNYMGELRDCGIDTPDGVS